MSDIKSGDYSQTNKPTSNLLKFAKFLTDAIISSERLQLFFDEMV